MDRKEAIKYIRWYFTEDDGMAADASVKEAIQALVPELKESEDERIRKEMLDYFKDKKEKLDYLCFELGDAKNAPFSEAKKIDDFLAYLEKQKEQRDYRKLYEDIAKSEWFKKAYEGKSLGGEDEQKEQKPVHTAKEMWKEMRLEVYTQASGNRHEPNYSDDSTKMFSLCDIDEIFEKIGDSTVGPQPAEWSEGDSVILNEIIDFFENETVRLQHDLSMYAQWLKSLRPQPKHEWSEEEKKTISFVIDVLRANHPDGFFKTSPAGDIHVTGITVEKLIKKLESLLSRPKLSDNWKPTEEQLHALYLASYGGELSSEDCLELDSLLIDLKKNYSI